MTEREVRTFQRTLPLFASLFQRPMLHCITNRQRLERPFVRRCESWLSIKTRQPVERPQVHKYKWLQLINLTDNPRTEGASAETPAERALVRSGPPVHSLCSSS